MDIASMKVRARKAAFLALLSWSAALPALAEGGESNIFAGDLGNVIWTLLVFGLVLFVLGKYAWGPVLSNLQAREKFIHDSLEQAKGDRDEAEARLREYHDKLAEARAEATEIVEEGRRDAEVVAQRVKEEAQTEADKSLQRAKREIELARLTAVDELYAVSGKLATEIAGRIVGRELKTADHERLISDSIAELDQTGTH
jgi:F-type H+-transporting ATPase subunit b